MSLDAVFQLLEDAQKSGVEFDNTLISGVKVLFQRLIPRVRLDKHQKMM